MRATVARVDREAPIRFVRTAYEADDWIAIFLKTYRTGETTQRVMPASAVTSPPFQAWLRYRNAHGWNVYASVNAVVPGRSRTRRAIAATRHVFLEEDRDGPALLATLSTRPDLPPPSYVLHTSPGRLHLFWRVRGFTPDDTEVLQKRLANVLGTDAAATSCSQTTRLPGFMNHKRARPSLVSIEYLRPHTTFAPADFPGVTVSSRRAAATRHTGAPAAPSCGERLHRARQFLREVGPAVAGQHGDLRTFRLCCGLVRGFALANDEALALLEEWNARCQPPWSERELRAKLRNARRYGREPMGGRLVRPYISS